MSHLGYTVFAKRPNRDGGFEYGPVGAVWPKVGPCENHQAYCQGLARDRGDTDVEYVIVKVSALSDATVRDTVDAEGMP